jgi:hypothetical protein
VNVRKPTFHKQRSPRYYPRRIDLFLSGGIARCSRFLDVIEFDDDQAPRRRSVQIDKFLAAHDELTAGAVVDARNDPNAVYYGGTYFGSDADPRIRAEILRLAAVVNCTPI